MTLETLVPIERVVHDLRAADKAQLLAELARRAGAALDMPPGDIAAALAAREALGSTGVGAGIAVPHAQLPRLGRTIGFLARLERPVDFASVDGQPVDLVFLLLGPPAARAEHLAALAAATRRLRDPTLANALRSAVSADAMRSHFVAGPDIR